MKEFNSHQYKEIYNDLGIEITKLGYLMLDVEEIPYEFGEFHENLFYKSKNPDRLCIDGFVGNKTAHITLLYGFLEKAEKYKQHIELLLGHMNITGVEVAGISYFDSPYEDEPYYCVVARVKVTEQLKEINERLQLLPHIRTFSGYNAHVTIGYIRKDEKARDEFIKRLHPLVGTILPVKGINYGGNKHNNK